MPLPITRDLVLLGGGHAHALVLLKWAMDPLPGARVTLINPNAKAPYTGMLPGYVAGHYTRDDLDIDLVRLARRANARLIIDEAIGIDTKQKRVQLSNRSDILYDTLSVDIGITSARPSMQGQVERIVPAKPLGPFSHAWAVLVDQWQNHDRPASIAIIGAGVAGVELALAMTHRLDRLGIAERKIHLIEANSEPLVELRAPARRQLLRELANAEIELHTDARVQEITSSSLSIGSDNKEIDAEFIVSAAGAQPHGWLEDSNLALQDGYISVDPYLQSTNTLNVFAVGDCAHLTHAPRPKAGVFAVRQAPVLWHNLRADLAAGAMRRFSPQRDYLKLISLGRKSAVTDKWRIGLSGDWVWRLKDRIDRKFMDQFKGSQAMPMPALPDLVADGVRDILDDAEPPCGACGAKVAQSSLVEALEDSDTPLDDAAILQKNDHYEVQSTDHLRAFNTDPYILAKVAAIHALGDIWAMGAQPKTALSHIILPPLSSQKQTEMLREIVSASNRVFEATGAEIVGGHTSVGAELTIGFSVTGHRDAEPISVTGAQAGDVIVLTKPIGTGVLLAAEMRQAADGDDYLAALSSMLRSSQSAAECLASVATAMTDVTGFGLAGHLFNILRASGVRAQLSSSNIPTLPGALALAAQDIRSSIWIANEAVSEHVSAPPSPIKDLLFDPQTCGGMLATVPEARIEKLLAEFEEANEPVWKIGTIREGAPHIEVLS